MAEPHAPSAHEPFVPASANVAEFTARAVVLGALLGILFAASSVYLALKVGLTVSASIPIAVLSITIFRALGRATILENNIVQTAGSAGESIAAGVAFTLPSLLLMGQDLEFGRVLLVAMLGGALGVLMMIPLRHGLIVKEHGKLRYPEGTACADVLIVGEQGGTNAKTVFLGFGLGAGYTILNLVLRLWRDTSEWAIEFGGRLKGATISAEVGPPLLGVGYIIGPRVAANMMAGGLLAYAILIPAIKLFGDGLGLPLFPATTLIKDMGPHQLRNAYVLYIGAGAVATGGFVALGRALPTIVGAFRSGLQNFKDARKGGAVAVPRTEQDLPIVWVIGGAIALLLAIWIAPMLKINFVSAALIVLFGFFFVTVSSRITGEIGSSSNPISGMTVATLLITCLLFLAVGWTGISYRAMALSTAAIVCVAASCGGTISQDLKTGFLVGATPRHQQVAIMAGVVTSALVIGWTLLFLNGAATTRPAVDHPGYVAKLDPTAGTETGPDGKTYRVHYVPETVGDVLVGKYLADDAGRLAYLVDPGVCGVHGWKYTPRAIPGVSARLVAGAKETELGPDRRSYRVLVIDPEAAKTATSASGPLPAGRYLVDPDTRAIGFVGAEAKKLDAPKARLFALIIDGILTQKLPWGLVLIGVFLALMVELLGVSSLPFAVGLYLPISTSGAIFVGGLARYLVDRRRPAGSEAEAEFSPGVLLSSGLIAGGAIAGLLQAGLAGAEVDHVFDIPAKLLGAGLNDLANFLSGNATWWPLLPFLGLALVLYRVGAKTEDSRSEGSEGGESPPKTAK